MQKQNLAVRIGILVGVLCGAAGCESELRESTQIERVAPRIERLIGGIAADDATLNAIGSLSIKFDDPSVPLDHLCTATLISADTALTAKHCIEALFAGWSYGARPVFTFGPQVDDPIAWEYVVSGVAAPGDQTGGFSNVGHDVAVLHLANPLPEFKPIALGTLTSDDVGQEYATIGYGVTDVRPTVEGQRRAGTLGLRGVAGLTYEFIFGSFDKFFLQYSGEALPPACQENLEDDGGLPSLPENTSQADVDTCALVPQARRVYESQRLELQAEFFAGGRAGEAQTCSGDSGGPFLRAGSDSRLTAYGVVSGGFLNSQKLCDFGSVFAGFDAAVSAFLEAEKTWVDPCGDTNWAGSCADNVAQRCSNPLEGARRLLRVDCGALGLSCNVRSDGSLACGEAAEADAASPAP